MKLFLFAVVTISSLILAPSTEGGICSRIASRRTSRLEARAERNLLLGDRIEYSYHYDYETQKTYGGIFIRSRRGLLLRSNYN